MRRPAVDVTIILDLMILFLIALVLDLQLLMRFVQHVLWPLVSLPDCDPRCDLSMLLP